MRAVSLAILFQTKAATFVKWSGLFYDDRDNGPKPECARHGCSHVQSPSRAKIFPGLNLRLLAYGLSANCMAFFSASLACSDPTNMFSGNFSWRRMSVRSTLPMYELKAIPARYWRRRLLSVLI
jgi:hypothetical protein